MAVSVMVTGFMTERVLGQARTLAEATLTDTVTVSRAAGSTLDANKTRVTRWVEVWSGPGLLQQQTAYQASQIDKGLPVTVTSHVLKVPVAADVAAGDRVTVTSSLDPNNCKTWQIMHDHSQGWAVLRRLGVDPVV